MRSNYKKIAIALILPSDYQNWINQLLRKTHQDLFFVNALLCHLNGGDADLLLLLYSSFLTTLLFLPINHKKWPLIMQVDNSTLHHTSFISQEETNSSTFFPSLLPLYGYYDKFKITMPAWPLPAFATTLEQFPAELINKIQAFCSHDDLLALTSVDKAALATRFCNPRLQKLSFKKGEDTAQFLSYCQATHTKEAQALILGEKQEVLKGLKILNFLKSALLFGLIARFPLFTRDHLQEVKALTLTLSNQLITKQYDLLFAYLRGIQHLTIYSKKDDDGNLSTLLKAAQHLTLQNLTIDLTVQNLTIVYSDNKHSYREVDHLPDELWQFTTLETLTILGFTKLVSIPEDIGRLKALKSLTLGNMDSLKKLPASLGQLNQLETLTLKNIKWLTALPKEIGQLNALKSITLENLGLLRTLPASLGQFDKLEALTLKKLPSVATLPENIGQLNALKSLYLSTLSLKALPANTGQLDKLEELTLNDLYWLRALPKDIGQLKALRSLTLADMTLLIALPASLGQLDKLEELTLKDLDNITALPEEMGQLKALKVVKLIHMGRLRTPPGKLAQIGVRPK
jgi:hypothetical protein